MDWEALARYLAGESPVEEQEAVQRWLASHSGDAAMLAALDDALAGLTLGPDAEKGIDVDAALARVKARRDDGLRVVPGNVRRGAPAPRRFGWMPLAAAAAVVLAAGALFWRGQSKPDTPTPTTIAARTLTTPVGGRDSLVLPDGSHVILGPGSVLTVEADYGRSSRNVSLRGEALFTVVHDESRPFIVAANGAEIRDVGTAFVVHSDGGGVRVVVTEGVVELTAGAAPRTQLNVGDAATVSTSGKVVAERGVGAKDDLAWTRGQLVFRDTPLSEVSEDLQRWYGVHLEIQDPALRRRPLSASFEGDSVRGVLNTIALAIGASIERRGDTVFVRALPR